MKKVQQTQMVILGMYLIMKGDFFLKGKLPAKKVSQRGNVNIAKSLTIYAEKCF
jgi:hypothetical protein